VIYENYKHSPSSGNMWIDSPSAFIWRYGFRKWGKDNHRTRMGKAAERAAYDAVFLGRSPEQAKADAMAFFKQSNDDKEYDDNGVIIPEYEAAGFIAKAFVEQLLPLGKPMKREYRENVPLLGYDRRVAYEVDLQYEEHGIIDLKATLKMPWGDKTPDEEKKPRWSHARQQGLYRHIAKIRQGKSVPVSLLYAAPKSKDKQYIDARAEIARIPDHLADLGARELLMAFTQIERWSNKFTSPEEAIRFIPLQLDAFWWKDNAEEAEEARQLWSKYNDKLQQAA
jgi:hypothetical protein